MNGGFDGTNTEDGTAQDQREENSRHSDEEDSRRAEAEGRR
jgi:hypothetical protein